MKRTTKSLTGGALGALLVMSPAAAMDCATPMDVIKQTLGLDLAVATQIGVSKAALLAQEVLERERLMGAIKVVTRQNSASGEQTAQVTAKATEAAASANVAQQQGYALADANEKYGVTGFRSCDLKTTAAAFYAANQAKESRAASIRSGSSWKPGQFGSPKTWASLATGSGPFDAAALTGGDTTAAQNYINFVIGPPVEKETGSPLQAGTQLFSKHAGDARKSVVQTVLSDIAAEHAADGPRARLAAMTKHWVGDDGGTAWATETSDKHQRTALLDAVRIEAANIASQAYLIKDGFRTELAFGSLALARINKKQNGGSGSSPVVGVSMKRAELR